MLVVTIIALLLGTAIYKLAGNVEYARHTTVSADVQSIDLTGVSGADYTNADKNLAFVIFCINPGSIDLSSVALSNYATNIGPYAQLTVSGSVKTSSTTTLGGVGSVGNVTLSSDNGTNPTHIQT